MNPALVRKEAAKAEQARRARNRLTLRVLIEDWKRFRLAGRRPSYAAEAVRALHYAFADHLDDAAEDLDRAAVVRALDALTRRRKRKDGDGAAKPKGVAMGRPDGCLWAGGLRMGGEARRSARQSVCGLANRQEHYQTRARVERC